MQINLKYFTIILGLEIFYGNLKIFWDRLNIIEVSVKSIRVDAGQKYRLNVKHKLPNQFPLRNLRLQPHAHIAMVSQSPGVSKISPIWLIFSD